jgi:DNA replication protein
MRDRRESGTLGRMKTSPGFAGFPEGRTPMTPVPAAFFTELLPAIDDLGELKVSLYALWFLARQPGERRFFRPEQFRQDPRLMQALRAPGKPDDEALEEALERAVARGTLLRAAAKGGEAVFLLNTPRGRAQLKALLDGEWSPVDSAPAVLEADRPTIYVLYEHNIGPLTPMIAESLKAAAAEYPPEWIEDAIRLAVENNVRKWRYVEAILEDWNAHGRDDRKDRGDSEAARRRYIEGEFADFIEH